MAIQLQGLNDIRRYLKESENPLFFFDDDPDGLCSYILLKKFIDRGKGVVLKSTPNLDVSYLRKIEEYHPDKIFVLDKPMVSQDFIDQVNVPLIWVDHHIPVKRDGVRYYNPRVHDKNDGRPVSYWCYKTVKQNLWIATVGVVSDWCIPDFLKEFSELYPDLIDEDVKDPNIALFETELGKLCRIFSFILKGKTSDVMKCINILCRIESPYEILRQETPRGKFIFKRAEKVGKQYYELLKKALEAGKEDDKLLLFIYPSGKMSFTGDLSNELLHRFPDRVIIVAREKDGNMRLSIRSKHYVILPILNHALKDVEGYGGGHEYACGANVAKKDFKKFVDAIRNNLK